MSNPKLDGIGQLAAYAPALMFDFERPECHISNHPALTVEFDADLQEESKQIKFEQALFDGLIDFCKAQLGENQLVVCPGAMHVWMAEQSKLDELRLSIQCVMDTIQEQVVSLIHKNREAESPKRYTVKYSFSAQLHVAETLRGQYFSTHNIKKVLLDSEITSVYVSGVLASAEDIRAYAECHLAPKKTNSLSKLNL